MMALDKFETGMGNVIRYNGPSDLNSKQDLVVIEIQSIQILHGSMPHLGCYSMLQ